MNRIWAPWRMQYIQNPGQGACIFCDKAGSPERDAENLLVLRGKSCFVLLNLFPYSNGHVMVAPNRHVGSLVDLGREELFEFIDLARQSMMVLERSVAPQGFNLGINVGRVGGAGVEGHIHFHIVPRWEGDTNYMPVIGDTKVIPESLEATYRKLRRAVEELGFGES